jgi:hypothetical protein
MIKFIYYCVLIKIYFITFQFEHEFKARQLCNWEVPKYHPARPEQRKNTTKVISNDRGHLLPCVKK